MSLDTLPPPIHFHYCGYICTVGPGVLFVVAARGQSVPTYQVMGIGCYGIIQQVLCGLQCSCIHASSMHCYIEVCVGLMLTHLYNGFSLFVQL